jgi:hypothetical protein
MPIKEFTFELDGGELELDLDYTYSYDPGCYSGLPENCYPAEEECEVLPPPDLANRVKRHAEKMIPLWIKQIESRCMDMELDNDPAVWAEEDRKNYEESKAEAYFEELKERVPSWI